MAKSLALSKSRIADGLTCEKKVYLSVHEPNLKAEIEASQQARFDTGNEIGELARKTFPNGYLIDANYWDVETGTMKTSVAIDNDCKTVFEATFSTDNLNCRIDVLHRESTKRPWQVFEVKSGLDAKPEYILDLAIQCWILNACGIAWEKASIIHLNRDCRYPDLQNLFIRKDVTDRVKDILEDFTGDIEKLLQVVRSPVRPEKGIGPQCDAPYECRFKDHCWQHIPRRSIFELPALDEETRWSLYSRGKVKITDLNPSDFEKNTKRAIEVVRSGKTHIDARKIATALEKWTFPLFFFDFETVNPAVPRFPGTGPYNQIPFQFSCHVWRSKDATDLEHFEYLHTEATDPRSKIISEMLNGLGKDGHVVAYNKGFETGVIRMLADFDSSRSEELLALTDRFVDPLPIFKANVMHEEFKGSFSIKTVAPALIGEKLNYESLEVSDGDTAQALADKILSGKITGTEKENLIPHLLTYCRQDTLAMVELVKWLYHSTERSTDHD